jgi:hypothetical protein
MRYQPERTGRRGRNRSTEDKILSDSRRSFAVVH